jgi:cytochrome b involved in lipid metabolism
MKKLVLFSIFTFTTLFIAGCGSTTNTTPIITVEPGNIESTGEPSTESNVITTLETWSTMLWSNTTGTVTTSIKFITLADVAKHTTESDCRTVINGVVYDVTAFFGKHPGGDKNLFRVCGIDATQVFNKKHGNDPKANNILAGFEIATLGQ